MYEIRFYRNRRGEVPVLEYMRSLAERSGKDARINLQKITDYISLLRQYGTSLGKPNRLSWRWNLGTAPRKKPNTFCCVA